MGADSMSPRAQRPAQSSTSAADLCVTGIGSGMKASLEHTASGTDILHCLEPHGRVSKGRSSRNGSGVGLSADDHPGSSAQYAFYLL